MKVPDAERIVEEILSRPESKQMNFDAKAYKASWLLVGSLWLAMIVALTIFLLYMFGS